MNDTLVMNCVTCVKNNSSKSKYNWIIIIIVDAFDIILLLQGTVMEGIRIEQRKWIAEL